ncbi:toxic anion resistance protein [Atopobacter sp. AH10]|uniref:toxic anion resistance protein n=1 Tax=Atopobacter sp. AH10 TaxID=2315861 RepID=UPI000EF28F06|nr:toxic anion resistance protein [Atopobacter sp. AH10]RLK62953.1 toxic anion resistance protein [Atopobacter sp. AH10]
MSAIDPQNNSIDDTALESDNLFQHSPGDAKSTSLDDLLANPFENPAESSLDGTSDLGITKVSSTTTTTRLLDSLTDERKQQAQQLAKQIDENNAQALITYGAAAQKKLGEFSHSILSHVRVKDTGAIGESLTELMFKLNETDPKELKQAEKNIFARWFGKARQSVYEITAKYQQIGNQVDKIAMRLSHERNGLINDNITLEKIYQQNKNFYEALNVYIAAGELKIDDLQKRIIPQAIEKAKASRDQMDVQKVHDLNAFVERLDKRNYDLKLTRQMTIQQAPQIRLIQNTNQALAEKIQSSVTTAVPLWKNQIAIALTLVRQRDALEAQKAVTKTTNDLLIKNSEMLKQSSIETAKENERGIIDIETLQKTQSNLVQSLEETIRIQQEGRHKRRLAERELSQMEEHLKNQLLELTSKERSWAD